MVIGVYRWEIKRRAKDKKEELYELMRNFITKERIKSESWKRDGLEYSIKKF